MTLPTDGTARPSDARALARELVSALEALATPPPGGPSAGPRPAGLAGAGVSPVSLDWPRQILENASRFVSPFLPADARMRGAKALILRALRIVTRDQTTFNSALLEALRSALGEIEGAFARRAAEDEARAASLRAAAEEAEARAAAKAHALGERLDGDARRLGERIDREGARLGAEVERQARAREALGNELVASQHRIDALEKERDLRVPAIERRIQELEQKAGSYFEEARRLRMEMSALRGEAASARGAERSGEVPAVATTPLPAAHAGVYAEFEETFRGSEEEIRGRQRRDVALFAGAPGPVADLGCGRGEMLEVLREAGVEVLGCDTNPVMVERARSKGLAVDEADLFGWLGARPDGSLGGVTAYQVIEHLPAAMLLPLVDLAARKLAPGGRLLLETVNPESVYAMRWFWMDLTHVRPVPAPSMEKLLTTVGFRDVRVDFRSPVPAADAVPAEGALEPIARLLFAPQDYAVTGVK